MINLQGLLARIERLEARLDNQTSSAVDFTTIAKTSADGSRDEATMTASDEEHQRPLLRTSPWGLASRPIVGVGAAIAKALAGSFGGMLVGIFTTKYGPQNLDEGETCLYCKADGTKVWLDKDGNVQIVANPSGTKVQISAAGDVTIDAGASNDVIVNGGSKKVARVDDLVNGGTVTGTDQITGNNILFVYTPAGGSAGGASTTLALTGGKITSGAPHFKG